MSATSEVSIANMALTLLGQQTIISFTDDNNRAHLASARYEDVRDAVLRSHYWNCAMKRATLASNATDPDWGFNSAFDLPVDFLRLMAMDDIGADYRIEGRQILSDATSMKILYVHKLTDVNTMDELLKQTIAARLAVDLCIPLAGSTSLLQIAMDLWERKLSEARYVDSMEGPTQLDIRPSSWLEARLVGSYSDLAQRGIAGS